MLWAVRYLTCCIGPGFGLGLDFRKWTLGLMLVLLVACIPLAQAQPPTGEFSPPDTTQQWRLLNDTLAQTATIASPVDSLLRPVDSVAVADTARRGLFRSGAWHPSDPGWPDPKRAVRLSIIFPGLGQLYNRRYWKLPIVYGLVGVAGYLIVSNHLQYRDFQQAYRFRTDGDPNTIDAYIGIYNDASLRSLRNFYRRNRDATILFTAIGYLLVAVEAYVDAHLMHFDVSDDLSLHIAPSILASNTLTSPFIGLPAVSPGLKLGLRF